MSLLQLARCCDCVKPQVPCTDCETNRCACEEFEYWEEDKPANDEDEGVSYSVETTQIPVTALHIEVSSMQTMKHRSSSTKNRAAWHYMNNKRWRATEFGPNIASDPRETTDGMLFGRINRLVLRAQSWKNGLRFGDKLSNPKKDLMYLVLPSGQWGRKPDFGLDSLSAPCPCGLTQPCTEMVACCYCDPPGGAHNGGYTRADECEREGGTIVGDEYTSLDECQSVCENQINGFTNARLGDLVPDPLRKGVDHVWRKIANSFVYRGGKKLEKPWKRLLRETAAETAINPVLRHDDAYDRLAKEEQSAFDARLTPISDTVKGIYEPQARGGGQGGPVVPDQPCGCGNEHCSQTGPFYEWLDFFDQRNNGVWNYVPTSADCCNAYYGSVSYTMEMDWPCEETAEAYIKAKQKYDFGFLSYEEAKRYCAQGDPETPPGDGQGEPECGGPGGPIHRPELCHPLARNLIGGKPPNLVPCIKTCPIQTGPAACRDEGWRRWPQGDYLPYGENTEQNIACLGGAEVSGEIDYEDPPLPEEQGTTPVVDDVVVTPTGDPGCSFKTNAHGRNYNSIANCAPHPCDPASCGGQFCCKVDCIELDCCEQLLVNPATGEFVEYNDDGCIVDEEGNPIGGWRTYPDEDGTYFRCPQQEVQTYRLDQMGGEDQVLCTGCTEDRNHKGACVPCGTENPLQPTCQGTGTHCFPRGDIVAWNIPRKKYHLQQGEYARHCPDHLEPFIINPDDPNYFFDPNCDRSILPSVGDPDFCWYDDRNPSGIFCTGGFCNEYHNQNNFGTPYHLWPEADVRHDCTGGFSGPLGPCEKRHKPDYTDCSPGGGGGPIGGGGDDCDCYFLEDMLLDRGHEPSFCGATPCDDVTGYVHVETGVAVPASESPGGPPDLSGNWRAAGCNRCSYKDIGEQTTDNTGCAGDPCQGPQGYNDNLIAYGDGYTSDEMGLQHINIRCGSQPHRIYESEALPHIPVCGNLNDQRTLYDSESHFTVSLEYRGAGCAYQGFTDARKLMSRQGQGQFTLAKNANAPSSCIFGHYTKLIGTADGWFTGGGANPAPYWQPAVNPGDEYYYKHMLGRTESGAPDCDRRIWQRPNNLFGCKFRTPSVLIF